jgi:inhibitor of cysteine peptidase
MKFFTELTVGASCLLLLTACASPAGQPRIVTVDEQKDNTTVELMVGDQLEISLEGNLTTGYAWMVKQVDETVLQSAGDPEYTPQGEALGSGGRYTIRLNAIASGETQVVLVYRRSFEPEDIPPVDQYNITVEVK